MLTQVLDMINKIVIGTVQFGKKYGINNRSGIPKFEEISRILNLCLKNNIKILDSAEAYGDAHNVIGKFHKKSDYKFEIITKFDPNNSELPHNLIKRIKKNICDLNIKSIYCYMFHSYDDYLKYACDFKKDLKILRDNNLIKKIGVSLNSNFEIERVIEDEIIDLIQLPFNLLDNYKLRSNSLIRAKGLGIEIHTRSVFLQGLFFKNRNSFSDQLIPLKKYLEVIDNSLGDNLKINELALKYVCNQKFIDKVLIGIDNYEQLKDNLSCLKKNISDDIFKKINMISVDEVHLLNPATWKI